MPDLWPSLAPCNGRYGRQGMNTLYTACAGAHSAACAPLALEYVRNYTRASTRTRHLVGCKYSSHRGGRR